MREEYERPISGDQPNRYDYNTENYDRFRADQANMQADEARNATSSSRGPGLDVGMSGEAMAGAIVFAAGAVVLYSAALYWFYTETRLGRWLWRGGWKVGRVLVIAFVLINTFLPIVMSVAGPAYFIYDNQYGEPIEGVWVFLILLVPLYFIMAAIRVYVGMLRGKTVSVTLDDTNPTTVLENGKSHSFIVGRGTVTNATSVGTRKMPGYRIDLQGAHVPRITVPLQEAPAIGTRLQWAAPSNSTARPIMLFDATNELMLFKQLTPPWTPPGAKRIIIGTFLVAAAIWFIGVLWTPFMVHFSSRILAVVALVHTLIAIILLFKLPRVIKKVLTRSPEAAQTYARDFLNRLGEVVTKVA
ncbi:MAG: hypothetical protein JNL52_12400 [Flavobacteriales bacterium]|nr:hypothetical protein [Flavobacteriales bacterium]